METVTTTLIGVGVLICIMSLILGIVEISTLKLIRPPKQKTFSYIRLAATQYQTIFVPALGAMVSGLFVSLAASFFYLGLTGKPAEAWTCNPAEALTGKPAAAWRCNPAEALTGIPEETWPQWVGAIMFISGAIALAVTLRAAFKGVGEPSELASDPFTIRAAAEEYAADPRRGTLDPAFLDAKLSDWMTFIPTRAMNISSTRGMKKSSTNRSEILGEVLDASSEKKSWRGGIGASIRVYFAALRRFPFRFMWPLIGFLSLETGVFLFAFTEAELDFLGSIRPYVALAVALVLPALSTLFYFTTRGNRARLWHRVNLVAIEDARKSISAARQAQEDITAENARIKQVMQSADDFLKRQNSGVEVQPERPLVLGALRVSITWRSIPKTRRK